MSPRHCVTSSPDTAYLIYTVGHGSRSIEEFLALLREAGVECVVDVRAFPASRRHPQFERDALERSLGDAGIRYVWEGKDLGGRRKPVANSPHVALRSPAFRAYADHMMTEDFRNGIARVIELGRSARTAIMCAERLPWECHRFLVSDFLVAGGENIAHLVNPGSTQEHRLNPIVRMRGGSLLYEGDTQAELKL